MPREAMLLLGYYQCQRTLLLSSFVSDYFSGKRRCPSILTWLSSGLSFVFCQSVINLFNSDKCAEGKLGLEVAQLITSD